MKNTMTKGIFTCILAGTLALGIGACSKKEFTHSKEVKTEWMEEGLLDELETSMYVIHSDPSVVEKKIESARAVLSRDEQGVDYIDAKGDYIKVHIEPGEYTEVYVAKGFDIVSKEPDHRWREYHGVFKTSKEYYIARLGSSLLLLDPDRKRLVKGTTFILHKDGNIYTGGSLHTYKLKMLNWEERMDDKK